MSAAIAVKFSSSVEVLTDRAVCEHGVYVDDMCKVRQLGELPLVLAGRGNVDFLERLERATVELFASVEGVDAGIAAMRVAFDHQTALTSRYCTAELILAGISESCGPQIWWFQTGGSVETRQAWSLYDVEYGVSVAEFIPGWAIDGYRCSETLADKATYLMNGRRGAGAVKDGVPLQAIGGGIDHTVISPAGVATRTIYTWPGDQHGRLLTDRPPRDAEYRRGELAMGSPALSISGNRKARKAAAAIARKAA